MLDLLRARCSLKVNLKALTDALEHFLGPCLKFNVVNDVFASPFGQVVYTKTERVIGAQIIHIR